ncbi:MAG: RecA-family ATPase [Herminiimonas sp.]|nr:RecA-family ATPase [Herminiimonas sp.]
MLGHLELEINERIAASVTLEALTDLITWYQDSDYDTDLTNGSVPELLGWDMRRHFGAAGFETWRDLMHVLEPPLLAENLLGPGDPRTPCTIAEYEAALVEKWALYDRPFHWTDHLIIDAMSRAQDNAWEPCGPPEVVDTIEAVLNDLATRSGAKRAAREAEADRLDAIERAEIDAEMEAAYAIYEAWQAAGEPESDPLVEEHRNRKRAIARYDAAAERTIPMPTPPNLSVVPAAPLPDLIQSSGEFVRGFVPPDYLVDGVLQRRFVYSITAQTGVGKTAIAMLISAHVATGRKLGNLDVEKGCVLYFAGENPTDIQMRWLGSTQNMHIDPETTDVHFVPGATALSGIVTRITEEVARKNLRPSLVVVDTAAAYFEGDDENSNTQAVDHARRLRSLTTLPGGPTVLILCHPTKRAAPDDLIPRGGGAFLNEVDGNIALRKQDTLIGAEVQGKFRGREFSPIHFELNTVYHPLLKDARGRDIPTVVARVIDDTTKQRLAEASERNENALLKVIFEQPGASLRTLATAMGWMDAKGQPAAMRVSRACDALAKGKMIVKHRNTWQCTPAGQKELNHLDTAATTHVTPRPSMPPFPMR